MSTKTKAQIYKAMKTQKAEFEAMYKLSNAFRSLPAVVDDDYPEMRERYESTLHEFIEAMRQNGRPV